MKGNLAIKTILRVQNPNEATSNRPLTLSHIRLHRMPPGPDPTPGINLVESSVMYLLLQFRSRPSLDSS